MAIVKTEDMGLVKEIQKVLLDDEDFLRVLVQENLQKIINSEFEDYIQAGKYERTSKRTGYRNGSYSRTMKTRVGNLELEIVRDREGNFNTELFRRYQRNEQALVLSLIEMYVQGVSTRKVKKIVEMLCGTSLSKSQISSLTKDLDTTISAWRERKLSQKYPYLIVDARYEDVRKEGVVQSQSVMLVVGVSDSGHRDILSLDIGDSENEQEWSAVFKRLKERGLSGVQYIVSDDHQGLVKAVKREFQGIIWQRCQVHFIRNLISKLSRKERPEYILKLKDIFAAVDKTDARERKDRFVKELEVKKPRIAEWLDAEIEHCFSVYELPLEHRKRMRSTNMLERFNQELLRRSRVVRIFPNVESCLRLFGAMCIEQSELWQSGCKYLDMDLLEKHNQGDWPKMARAV